MEISQAQIELLQRDADRGIALAQFSLGWMYFTGKGLARDYTKAFEWYSKAAEQGYVLAQVVLYSMYRKGTGVKTNPVKAAEWAMKAAYAGNVQAQANLGNLYLKGFGVAKNRMLAYSWLTIARIYGYQPWHHRLSCYLLKKSLTKNETKESQFFVTEWQENRRRKLAD